MAQSIEAQSVDDFCWSGLLDAEWVRGALDGVSGYVFDSLQSETLATCFSDAAVPAPGSGFYYVVQPDCALGSWQTEIGAEPERDVQLP